MSAIGQLWLAPSTHLHSRAWARELANHIMGPIDLVPVCVGGMEWCTVTPTHIPWAREQVMTKSDISGQGSIAISREAQGHVVLQRPVESSHMERSKSSRIIITFIVVTEHPFQKLSHKEAQSGKSPDRQWLNNVTWTSGPPHLLAGWSPGGSSVIWEAGNVPSLPTSHSVNVPRGIWRRLEHTLGSC